MALCWWLAVRTKAGLIVRGTMRAPEMASCLGVDRNRVYMATFARSCLAGLAGAALAPLTGVSPAMGGFFVAKAFITVIVGGHLPLVGASAASTLFGAIDGAVSYAYSSVLGEVTMLIAAVLLLRMPPLGITGRMSEVSSMSGSTFSMDFDAHAGRSPRRPWWFSVLACTALMLAVPQYGDTAMQLDLSLVMILSLLALSIGFLWGYVGILSFGQTIFFGLGGYAYAVQLNTDLPLAAFALAAVVPMLFALLLGYFMMYGRISDIYLSVITLVVTLIFEKGVRATSGPEYVIGSVRLNGQNGIPGLPGLPLRIGPLDLQSIEGIFYLALGLLALAYIGIRLAASAPGRVMVGLRENERRMELLGYDSRRYKLMAFVIAGGLAGLSGGLYALWGNFVGPEMFSLNQAAMVVIWVIVGGRSLLLGAIIGTLLIQYLTTWLGTVGVGQVTLNLGFILILCVLLFPQAGAGMQELAGPAAAAAALRERLMTQPDIILEARGVGSAGGVRWAISTSPCGEANCAA